MKKRYNKYHSACNIKHIKFIINYVIHMIKKSNIWEKHRYLIKTIDMESTYVYINLFNICVLD